MCILCLDGSPVEDDKRGGRANTWDTSLCKAPCADPCYCIGGVCPISCCCIHYSLRKSALHDDMTKYMCCQGYFDCCCLKAGNCNESSCPEFCLCLEIGCCCECAVQATRMYVMDERQLQPDPCDNRLIRFNNCMQITACICYIVGCVTGIEIIQDAAWFIDRIADAITCTILGCMTAQTHHEMGLPAPSHNTPPVVVAQPVGAPEDVKIER